MLPVTTQGPRDLAKILAKSPLNRRMDRVAAETTKAPDVLFSGPSMVAGAGFEPATFGL